MGAAVTALAASVYTAVPAAAEDMPAVASATRYELIDTYDLARLDKVFGEELKTFMKTPEEAAAFDGLFPAARYPVKLYKVSYPSVVPELDNLPTVASGLVAVPETGLSTMPVVSYQHGTVFDRNYVPSRPDQSMETRIMIARFAAQGYVVIGADYFGRGDSDLPDGYLVKASAQQANYDMLIAANSVLGALGITPGKLFLSGWSQGGWTTLVHLERLEELGVPVTAAAVASGPPDIALILNRWLNNPQPVDAPYLPGAVTLLLLADESYHQVPGLAQRRSSRPISRRRATSTPGGSISTRSMRRRRRRSRTTSSLISVRRWRRARALSGSASTSARATAGSSRRRSGPGMAAPTR
jgi:hypothetical protein